MITKTYSVRFNTPAFLGNAEQSGQWRTPPFKHLLREWWRVAWAAQNDPSDWEKMREVEARLFGHAWWKGDQDKKGKPVSARKSEVLLRLAPWEFGSMSTMPRTRPAGERAPQSAKYLAYGPEGNLNSKPAISEESKAVMRLAWPKDGLSGIEFMDETLKLIQAFGTLGGRSRNGWGSLWFNEIELFSTVGEFSKPWKECLNLEWAHSIGEDENGQLIWTTGNPVPEWTTVIESLAKVRKSVNSLVGTQHRKILNQPVAGRGGRVPSSLRFKVRRDSSGRFYGVIFHMPCTPPQDVAPNTNTLIQVWQKVHGFLDAQDNLRRSSS